MVGEADSETGGGLKYKELMPDIVTMDLAMDDGDGIEAIREIMSHNPNANVIVVSSTAGQEPIVREAMELGAKAILSKPRRACISMFCSLFTPAR